MKNIFRSRRVWMLAIFILLCAVVIFWPRKQSPHNGYSIVLCESNPDAVFIYHNNHSVLTKIQNWYYEFIGENGYREVQLSDQQAEELGKLFSSYDLNTEGQRIESVEGPLPYYRAVISVANFVVGIDGESYILTMPYRGAVSATETFDSNIFTLYKARLNRKGLWEVIDPDNRKFFNSKRLYDDLDEFLKNLPASSPGRAEYDIMHNYLRNSVE